MSGDAIVIGAGLSGLTAATELEAAGVTVTVLEAADRIGGKVLTRPLCGVHVDYGAHWIGGDQTAVLDLAAHHGLETAPEPRPRRGAKQVLALTGGLHRHRGDVPLLSPARSLALARGIVRMSLDVSRIHSSTLPVIDPWRPEATDMSDVLEHRCFRDNPDGRQLLTCFYRLIFGADPDQVPARAALEYIHAAGGLRPIASVENGAQERYFVDGTTALVDAVAAGLTGEVLTDHPVTAIHQDPRGVEVHATVPGGGTRTFRSDHVVLAVPLPRAPTLEFFPALPSALDARLRGSRMGEYAKTIVVYDRPWWRALGLTGTALDADGPIQMVVDGNAASDGPGVLVAFSGGRAAAELFAREDRREVVVTELVRLFGSDAQIPHTVDDITWSEQPWLGGAPTAVPASGGPFRPDELRHGRIHWAGTDVADRWPGYLDGAVRAGRRAAHDVLATRPAPSDPPARPAPPTR